MIKFSTKNILFHFASFVVSNPLTGNPCVTYQKEHGIEDMVQQKIKLEKARQSWSNLSLSARKDNLHKFVTLLSSQRKQLQTLLCESTGKKLEESEKQIGLCLDLINHDITSQYVLKQEKKSGFYQMKPYDNILVSYDHRYAALTTVKYIGLSAITGNSLILKPQRYGLPIAKRIEQIWHQALPQYPVLYCPINNFADGLEFWIKDNQTGFVSFSGDIDAGNSFYHFMAGNSEIFAQSQFLLTSSDSAYITKNLSPQSLEKACQNLAEGCFMSAGTNFMSIKRIFVDDEIADKFKQKFLQAAGKYQIKKQNSKMSAIITSSHIKQAKQRMKELQNYESSELKKWTDLQITEVGKAMYMSPLIYEVAGIPDLDYWNKIYHMPICFVERVSSQKSCISKINESIYGISCTIYSSDHNKIQQIGAQLDVGVVFGNRWGFPFGVPISPRKRSGKGWSFSPFSLDNVVKSKSVKGLQSNQSTK